jgi:Fe-S cluster assembly protein SufD
MMSSIAPTLDRYAAAFEAHGLGRRGSAPSWLVEARREALDRFLARGFPTPRDEEWRFTSVAPIAAEPFELAGASGVPAGGASGGLRAPAYELVFVNGRHAPSLSSADGLPEGVRLDSLAAALASGGAPDERLTRVAAIEGQPFAALNTAFLTDGAFISIAPGTVLERPIHVRFLSAPAAGGPPIVAHPRVFAAAGRDSRVSIVETYAGPGEGRSFTNAVTEIVVDEGAVVDHYTRQLQGPAAFHVGALHVRAARGAQVSSHSIGLGGGLVRNDVVAVLDGEGAGCTLDGLYLADGERLVDNHTTIDHARPHCGSRELYKGILAGRARGVFNGKVIVRPDAQQTDARQTNRALLLSDAARINSKPQLEIFANDVKCTHGAAIGQLDEEAVFYLRSRGLSGAEARRVLVRAFAAEVIGRMPLEAVRADTEAALASHLARLLPSAA